MARMGAPPTRQLYIRFHGPSAYFPRTERDIERVFRDFGPIKKVRLLPKGDAAILHFLHTGDAKRAKEEMHERLLHNTSYFVYFNRASRLLFFDYLPPIAEENIRKMFSEEFGRFGPIERIDILEKKSWAFIMYKNEADAARAVASLQNKRDGEWVWEIEFYKVQRSVIWPLLSPQEQREQRTPGTAPGTPLHPSMSPYHPPPPDFGQNFGGGWHSPSRFRSRSRSPDRRDFSMRFDGPSPRGSQNGRRSPSPRSGFRHSSVPPASAVRQMRASTPAPLTPAAAPPRPEPEKEPARRSPSPRKRHSRSPSPKSPSPSPSPPSPSSRASSSPSSSEPESSPSPVRKSSNKKRRGSQGSAKRASRRRRRSPSVSSASSSISDSEGSESEASASPPSPHRKSSRSTSASSSLRRSTRNKRASPPKRTSSRKSSSSSATPSKGKGKTARRGSSPQVKAEKERDKESDRESEKGSKEKEAKEKEVKAEAKEREAKEKEAKEKEAKEKEAKEREAKEKEAKEKEAREREAKEREANERELKLAKEKEAKEREAREKEAREREAKEKEAREREAKEKEAKEREAKEKEKEAKERELKLAKEKEAREKEAREKETKEREAKEKEAKEKEAKEREAKEKEAKAKAEAATKAAQTPEKPSATAVKPAAITAHPPAPAPNKLHFKPSAAAQAASSTPSAVPAPAAVPAASLAILPFSIPALLPPSVPATPSAAAVPAIGLPVHIEPWRPAPSPSKVSASPIVPPPTVAAVVPPLNPLPSPLFSATATTPSSASLTVPTPQAPAAAPSVQQATGSPAVPKGMLHLKCSSCESFVRHLRQEHTHKEVDMLKKIVEAWFYGTFDAASVHNNDALLIQPIVLLEQDINPFLRSIGAPEWNARTALFNEWFLRELNGFTDEDIRSQTSLRLVRKGTLQGYKDRLRALLQEDLDDGDKPM